MLVRQDFDLEIWKNFDPAFDHCGITSKNIPDHDGQLR
jgi:hypothetical protein